MSRRDDGDDGTNRVHRGFASFSTWFARRSGSHWTLLALAVAIPVSIVLIGLEATAAAGSIVTLLMVFVLQNTQARDSAALHLKLDEIVRAEPRARDEVRGVEVMPAVEIHGLGADGEPEGGQEAGATVELRANRTDGRER